MKPLIREIVIFTVPWHSQVWNGAMVHRFERYVAGSILNQLARQIESPVYWSLKQTTRIAIEQEIGCLS